MTMTAVTNYADRLAAACAAKRSTVCMGIDPRAAMLPPEFAAGAGAPASDVAAAYERWALALLEVAAPLVPVVKPQSAFFEALGAPGVAALEATVARARELGCLVIADVKRGDIGSTAEAYAQAHFDHLGADALTVSPYLGRDTLAPFLERCRSAGKGIYVLVKTSNAGSADLQDRESGDGLVHEHVARTVADVGSEDGIVGACGWSSVGAVTGATYPRQIERLRELMPATPFLVPGYGAQGGGAADCKPAYGTGGLGAVVNSSRGITFAFAKGEHAERFGPDRWRESVRAAIEDMTSALNAVVAPPAQA